MRYSTEYIEFSSHNLLFWFSGLLLIVFLRSGPALASVPVPEAGAESTITMDDGIIVSGRVALGLLNGESQEFVYENRSTVSELIWTFDNIMMLGGGVSVQPWPGLKTTTICAVFSLKIPPTKAI
ncbi:MAG: omptin family outer membrane protease [Spirochaetales bacterium]|nr:omptin family outer membrane protease [Spirochaetales bacterium]